ncbi:MAG: amidohydrolase family protein, partial [Planctomycetota bacterium]
VKPGERIEDGAVLLENGWITAVGKANEVQAPAGTAVHDLKGKTVYAGLIDAGLVVDSAAAARAIGDDASAHWNRKVTPQLRVADLPSVPSAVRKELRDLGFTIAAVHPNTGIFRGEGAVVLLAEDDRKADAIVPNAAQVIAFAHVGDDGPEESRYPAALMGAMALVRQTLHDANWHAACERAWKANPQGNDPPEASAALAALEPAMGGREAVVFDVSDEHDLLRAVRVAREFGLQARMLASGTEFRRLDDVVAAKVPLVVPMEFPKTPDVSDPRKDDATSLRDLQTWALAPRNLKRLLDAGVDASVGTHRLKKRGDLPARARRAMADGLSEDELLGCLTMRPAAQLGLSKVAGSVESGRMANLLVTDGPLFGEKTHVVSTWIAGVPSMGYEPVKFAFRGAFTLNAKGVELTGTIDPDAKSIAFEKAVPAPAKPV